MSFVPGTHFHRQKTKYTKPATKPVPTNKFSGANFLKKKYLSNKRKMVTKKKERQKLGKAPCARQPGFKARQQALLFAPKSTLHESRNALGETLHISILAAHDAPV